MEQMFQPSAADNKTWIKCSKNVYIFLVKDFPVERIGNIFQLNIHFYIYR